MAVLGQHFVALHDKYTMIQQAVTYAQEGSMPAC
jgi:hypothetical protein